MENQNIRYTIVFVVGLIVGLGGYWLWDNRTLSPIDSSTIDTLSTNESASSTASIMQEENTLLVNDQPAGKTVEVAEITLKNPGWVAIHDDVNGQPGPKILGAKEFNSGTNSGTFGILRATEKGKSYIAVLRSDDGNLADFNTRKDLPLKDASGAIIMVKFTAQ